MNEEQFIALLESTEITVVHYFSSVQMSLPYMAYWVNDGSVRGSDQTNEVKTASYIVELYSDKDDTDSKAVLEAALNAAGIPYGYSESYLESERAVMTAYYVTLTTKMRRT